MIHRYAVSSILSRDDHELEARHINNWLPLLKLEAEAIHSTTALTFYYQLFQQYLFESGDSTSAERFLTFCNRMMSLTVIEQMIQQLPKTHTGYQKVVRAIRLSHCFTIFWLGYNQLVKSMQTAEMQSQVAGILAHLKKQFAELIEESGICSDDLMLYCHQINVCLVMIGCICGLNYRLVKNICGRFQEQESVQADDRVPFSAFRVS